MSYTTRCPGKINLGLRILGERKDGYHDLDTVFCQLALADTLTFRPGEDVLTLHVESARDIGDPEHNLVMKATREFERLTGERIKGAWHLRKNIPPAAGLGGGSSDAAGALRVLHRIYDIPGSHEALFRCAADIGADVPFFLLGGMARGRGRGEILDRLAWPETMYIVLVIDETGLSTAAVYEQYRSGSRPRASGEADLIAELRGIGEGMCRILINDLSPAAYILRPELRKEIALLSRMDFHAVGLSGSGPTIYGITGSHSHARRSMERLRASGRESILTRFKPTVPPIVVKDA